MEKFEHCKRFTVNCFCGSRTSDIKRAGRSNQLHTHCSIRILFSVLQTLFSFGFAANGKRAAIVFPLLWRWSEKGQSKWFLDNASTVTPLLKRASEICEKLVKDSFVQLSCRFLVLCESDYRFPETGPFS